MNQSAPVKFCQACGAEVPKDAQFCTSCGKQLGAPAPSSPAESSPSAPAKPQRDTITMLEAHQQKAKKFLLVTKLVVVLAVVIFGLYLVFGPGNLINKPGSEESVQTVLPNASAVAAYNLGLAQLSMSKYDEAIAKFTEAIELDPKYALAYNGRGFAYDSKKQYDLAIADYNKSIELNPKYFGAYHNRGITYSQKEQFDLAIADYTIAIKLDPGDINAYRYRGDAYRYKGQPGQAIADYKKVIELSKNAETTRYATERLAELGQTPEVVSITPPTTPTTPPAIGLRPDVIPLTIDTRFVSQLRAYITVWKDGHVGYGVSSTALMAYGGSPLVRYTWSNHLMGRIPPLGTIVDPNGVFRYTGGAIAEGTYTFDEDVSDGSHTATAAYTVIVEKQVEGAGTSTQSGQSGGIPPPPPPLWLFTPLQQPGMSTIPLVDGRAGQPYAASLLIIGGHPPYLWSANPADQFALATSGLSIDPISGIVKGTINPSMLGQTIKFRVIVQDSPEGTYPGHKSTEQGGDGPVYTINVK